MCQSVFIYIVFYIATVIKGGKTDPDFTGTVSDGTAGLSDFIPAIVQVVFSLYFALIRMTECKPEIFIRQVFQ